MMAVCLILALYLGIYIMFATHKQEKYHKQWEKNHKSMRLPLDERKRLHHH